MKKTIIITVSIIVAAVIVVCAVMGVKYYTHHIYNSPEKAVKSFVNALNDQNLDDMLNCIDPGEAEYIKMGASFLEDKMGTDSLTQFKKWLPFLSSFADVNVLPQFELEIINVKTDDSSAKVKTKLTNKENGDSFEYEFKLISSDSRWYIQLVSF